MRARKVREERIQEVRLGLLVCALGVAAGSFGWSMFMGGGGTALVVRPRGRTHGLARWYDLGIFWVFAPRRSGTSAYPARKAPGYLYHR